MTASVTPAAAAISRVVVPLNPFWENTLRAVSRSWVRRSVADIRPLTCCASGMYLIVSKHLLTCQLVSVVIWCSGSWGRGAPDSAGEGFVWFTRFRDGG